MAAHIVSRSTSLLIWFVFLLLSQQFLSALGQNAEISGTVTDPSKAVIPHALIEIVETATQVKWDTVSNGDGRYAAPSLAPGVYQVTVQSPTFETNVVSDLRFVCCQQSVFGFRSASGSNDPVGHRRWQRHESQYHRRECQHGHRPPSHRKRSFERTQPPVADDACSGSIGCAVARSRPERRAERQRPTH